LKEGQGASPPGPPTGVPPAAKSLRGTRILAPRTPPERLDAFMTRANAAYYATHNPFADFTTSPEISQMFGELLGAWAAATWQSLGSPTPFILAEAGPGRGTLMADALRATARVAPAFTAAARLHLIETSPRLRAEQAARLPTAIWHDTLETIPPGPMILLANEFLDALPIRQFEHTRNGWRERYVQNESFTLHPTDFTTDAPIGTVIERCEAAITWLTTLAHRLRTQCGTALILDYGPATPTPGDTLQALRQSKPAPPLSAPGTADLTAHVDFPALITAAHAAGLQTWGPVPQGDFLNRLGLALRLTRLTTANPTRAPTLHEAADRLTAPNCMGELFKVLALGTQQPPALE
jgi:NADH dehydrogenase [ubiquinone] 1 alpha subcomplex assembly factor 7